MVGLYKGKKPRKPSPDFPLFPHNNGSWCKKVRGKLCYFGPWADPQAALQRWVDEKDELLAGRTPRTRREDIRLRELLNRFLSLKQSRLEAGELAERTFTAYFQMCERVGRVVGLDAFVVDLSPDDFERVRQDISKTCGPKTLTVELTRIRVLLKYAFEQELVNVPIRHGGALKSPPARVLRREKLKVDRTFTAGELRQILEAAGCVHLKAQILLALNCAYTPSDIGQIPLSALDLGGGWADFERPKTFIQRRAKLWAETVSAVGESLKSRPDPLRVEHAERVFITSTGRPWSSKRVSYSLSSTLFCKVMKRLSIHRPGRGFGALRHCFRTAADPCGDIVAINHVMGHTDPSMGGIYRLGISDERLQIVSQFVHNWLYSLHPS